jgi:Tol biopolymer transport system component
MDDEDREPGADGRVHGQPVQFDDRPLAGGAPIAPDSRWWNDVEGRHRTLIIGGIVAGVVVLAVGIGVAVGIIGSRLSQNSGPKASLTQTIPETSESVVTTIPSPSQAATESSATTQTQTSVANRAPYLAFRKDDAVWVAKESGADPKRVFNSVQGPYALSPDGRTLAVVDAASQTLSLVDVDSGRQALVGKAVDDRPSWSLDSSVVAYSSQVVGGHDTEVSRVNRDGSGRATVGPGFGGRFAPDGAIVALSSARTAEGTPIEFYAAGGVRRLTEGVTVNALTPLGDRIIFADAGELLAQDRLRSPSLQVIRYDGSGQKTLVAKPAAGTETYFGDMMASPDGAWVAYTETGDDGYSRLFAIHPSGGVSIPLSLRRDDYIMGWSADGSEIMFVEGNQAQEESTRLMAVHPDGTGRRIVIDGAGQ